MRLITSIRKPAARAIATLQALRAFRPIAGSSSPVQMAGAIRMGQHDGMPDPEIRLRPLDGTLTAGVAHGQVEGLLLDRPVSYGRFEETVASNFGYGVINY